MKKAISIITVLLFMGMIVSVLFTACSVLGDMDEIHEQAIEANTHRTESLTITITTHPSPKNLIVGDISGSLAIEASVEGDLPLSYQWYKGTSTDNSSGTLIPSATSVSYTIPTDLTAGSYYYFCEVSATGANPVRSSVAVITVVNPGITITTHPASREVSAGSISGSLTVTAVNTGSGTLRYQWYSNTTNSNSGGSSISGATSASYTIPTTLTTAGSPYYYFCEVSATGADPVRSNVAAITVVSGISIGTQPGSATVYVGSISGSLSVSASVTGNGQLNYQWFTASDASYGNPGSISGAASASYTIPTTLTAGTYYYFCEVSSAGATTVRSSVAVITVNTPVISIGTQPSSPNFTVGNITGSLTVAATVTDGKTPAYQWYSNTSSSNDGGSPISGATSASYTIPTSLTAGPYYYFCEVSSPNAVSVRSGVGVVTVSGVKTVTVGVQNNTITAGTGGDVTFTVTTSYIAPTSYPAVNNVANLPSGVTAVGSVTIGTDGKGTLTLHVTAAAVGATYNNLSLTIDGVQSGAFTLTITQPTLTGMVSITSTSNWVGGTLTADISSLGGTGTANFQWRRNGTNIGSKTTTPTYTIVDADRTTNISVVVDRTGYIGTETSSDFPVSKYYPISNQAELAAIQSSRDYILINNIPSSGTMTSWTPIATYAGELNGNGKTIAFGSQTFTQPASGDSYFGLFNNLSGTVKNFKLTGSFTVNSSTANSSDITVGTVAGKCTGNINNISSRVSITAKDTSNTVFFTIGGIVGLCDEGSTIMNCSYSGDLKNTVQNCFNVSAGGIAGQIDNTNSTGTTNIQYCWADGTVDFWIGVARQPSIGGIVGDQFDYTWIDHCVALQSVVRGLLPSGTLTTSTNDAGRIYGYSVLGLSEMYGRVAYLSDNYAINTMQVNGSATVDPPGAVDNQHGAGVALTTAQGANGTWWNGIGWNTYWGGTGATEEKPWKWPTTGSRPILWFETAVN